MNGISIFRHIPTGIQLNPSKIVFTQQPTNQSICIGGVATFEAIAALDPSDNQTGSFSYKWFLGPVPLIDGPFAGGTISGTSTNVLTISNPTEIISSEIFSILDFRVRATFNPTGTTPNPSNNPEFSDGVKVEVLPDIFITKQPVDFSGIINEPAVFTVEVDQTTPGGLFIYQWTLDGDILIDGVINDTFENSERTTTVSGATTDTLTLSSNQPRTGVVQCVILHTTACNFPAVSDTAQLEIVIPNSIERSILRWEVVKDDQAILLEEGSQNIYQNPLNFNSSEENYRQTIVMWAPERDVEVYMTLEGAAGQDYVEENRPERNRTGGAGGKSIFGITLKRNTEYVFRLGPALEPFGGRGGGGGAAFFYEKGQLLTVIGGGGGAGRRGNGGSGGGINLAGGNGISGSGGDIVPAGSLPVTGLERENANGGRVDSCTLGDYYQSEGISPCIDVGLVKFRTADGTIVEDSAILQRGYKAGGSTNRNNGGNSNGLDTSNTRFVGGGGSGATGGQGTRVRNGSGAGGSGYTNGTVLLLESTPGANITQFSKVNISLPFPIAPPLTTVDIIWTIQRNTTSVTRIVFIKESGNGPESITWGPQDNIIVTPIQKGSVYILDRIIPARNRRLRVTGNTLELESDRDGDFDDLQITPNLGTFVSTTRYEF